MEQGFHWKHGVERDTTGIWMWNKPFLSTLPDGRTVAVFLVDTQVLCPRVLLYCSLLVSLRRCSPDAALTIASQGHL